MNIILSTDALKVAHWKQYSIDEGYIYCYMEAREGARFPGTTWFGLQSILRKLQGEVVTREVIDEAYRVITQHYGDPHSFNLEGWEHIRRDHHGKLPLKIFAADEGLTIPNGCPLLSVINTCPKCYWLPNYVESLLMHVWYPSTVCTLSREIKKILLEYYPKQDLSHLLKDFGYRGSTSEESACIGAAAHLVNFTGSSTLPAIRWIEENYGENPRSSSIPAAEHSVVTSYQILGDNWEMQAYDKLLSKGAQSIVIDTVDNIEGAKKLLLNVSLQNALNRNTIYFRPDSGDPTKVIPELLELIGAGFIYQTDSKGLRIIHRNLRIIQGDGVTIDNIPKILDAVVQAGYSPENLVFGSGGGLLQKVDRDTQKFAFKASAISTKKNFTPISKQTVGKESKAGIVFTDQEEKRIFTNYLEDHTEYKKHSQLNFILGAFKLGILISTFEDGKLYSQDFSSIRKRARL